MLSHCVGLRQVSSRSSKADVKGVAIAIIYGTCSASMAFANKGLLTTYRYNYPIFLVVVQMALGIVVLEVLRLSHGISLPAYSVERGETFFLPSVFYAMTSVLGLWALSGMNIPMYGVMKRCTPLVVLLLGSVMLKRGVPSPATAVAVACISFGCVVAGFGDLGFNAKNYILCAVSVVSQSMYLVLVQRSSQTYTATETLHLNSYNSLPLLLLVAVAFGELSGGLAAFQYSSPAFMAMFLLVGSMGCLLNYLLFLCTVYNSALTTRITGVIKSVIQTLIGMFTFEGIAINVYTMSGIVMNLGGGVLYTYTKFRESQAKELFQDDGSSVETVENGCVLKATAEEPVTVVKRGTKN